MVFKHTTIFSKVPRHDFDDLGPIQKISLKNSKSCLQNNFFKSLNGTWVQKSAFTPFLKSKKFV